MAPSSLLSVSQLLADKSLLVIDIRPPEERWGEFGFIPGSLSVHTSEPWTHAVSRYELTHASGVVLACLSGHRARAAWRESIDGRSVFILDGGILAWSAEGLPLARRSAEVMEGVDSFQSFRQALRACFVAEWIESSLNQEIDNVSDPVQLLELCFEAEQVSEDSWEPQALRRVLDRLARLSLRVGTEYPKVASNLSIMLNTISQSLPKHTAK